MLLRAWQCLCALTNLLPSLLRRDLKITGQKHGGKENRSDGEEGNTRMCVCEVRPVGSFLPVKCEEKSSKEEMTN